MSRPSSFRTPLFALMAVLFVVSALASVADAYSEKVRLPLTAARGYLTASGSAVFTKSVGEPGVADGHVLTIDVSNVPLPAGTELVVYVHHKEVGVIKLDKDRGGKLVIGSAFRKLAPSINYGSFIVLKLDTGETVMW